VELRAASGQRSQSGLAMGEIFFGRKKQNGIWQLLFNSSITDEAYQTL